MLNLWIKYYKRYFTKLFVVKWNTKPKYNGYFRKLEKVGIESEFVSKEDILRYGNAAGIRIYLQKKQVEFFSTPNEYDWVLFTNCDEYLITTPKHKDLKDLMQINKDYINCTGYDVIQVEGENDLNFKKPILKQRKYWIKNNNYNKILLSRVPLDWVDGLHKLGNMTDDESRKLRNQGLYLVHLKHADLNAKRDFGPEIGHHDPNITQHWLKFKKKIPEYIKII